jgi:hypothetical protein
MAQREGDAMLGLREVSMRAHVLLLTLVLTGCSSTATYIHATVPDNPLPMVEKSDGWYVDDRANNSLQLSNVWTGWSLLLFSYASSHAELAYTPDAHTLDIRYYLEIRPWWSLFLWGRTHDAEQNSGMWGTIMNQQIQDLLRTSHAEVLSRRSGDISEPFPSKVVAQ